MAELVVQPLPEAIAKMGSKSPVGSVLTSAQWQDVPLALRDRGMFSARVESVRFVAEMQRKLTKQVGMLREQVAHGQAFVTRDSFIGDMKQLAEDLGVQTTDTAGAGGLQDIRSRRRLGLIHDIQTQQASEYARWKMDQDPDILDAYPAQELVRIEGRDAPRDWRAIWAQHGGPTPGGRMAALKSDPIWAAISHFGTPYPPFHFQSGMGLAEIPRDEAEELGLIAPGQTPTPASVGFNDSLQASVKGLSPEQRAALAESFGDQVKMVGDSVQWVPDAFRNTVRRSVANPQWSPKKPPAFGRATSRTVDLARAARESIDLTGTSLTMPPDRARHIWDRHGPESTDPTPLTESDLGAIPTIWAQPDRIQFDGVENTVSIFGRSPTGDPMRLVVERRGPKRTRLVTAHKVHDRP